MAKRKEQTIIGITGTPGTGKKTIGRIVAQKLGYEFVEVNRLARTLGAEVGRRWKEIEVETSIIYKRLPKILKNRRAVLVGHLLPYCLPDHLAEFVAVLRCSPKELIERYKHRGYSKNRMKSNVIVEAIDLCLSEALGAFERSKISEIDATGKRPEASAEELLEKLSDAKKRKVGVVNWLKMMVEDEELRDYLK